MTNPLPNKILIVDDEEDIRALIRGILEDEGYQITEAENSNDAFNLIEDTDPDLVILDIWLQGSEKDGMEILEEIAKRDTYLPVLMISGHGTIETAVSAIKKGAYDFIEKPFKSDRLILMINRALEMAKLKNENKRLKDSSDKYEHNLLGQSAPVKNLRQQIEKIALSNSRVFIKGEAGTGKEVVAREIHRRSVRKDKTFMAVNCAALHPERLEEELFGVQKGEHIQKGVLELANGGTLFLDEVVDMPLETQGKILRVLQENKFEPVGSHKSVIIDVRVMASTNKDIDQALQNGRFREDLLYRLNVVTLNLLPLKERKDDILLLAAHFLNRFAKQTGQTDKDISPEVERIFKSHSWPGNVRQLKNVMEWITIMNNFDVECTSIQKDHLPPEFASKPKNATQDKQNEDQYIDFPLREARESFERRYLTDQVKRFDGNISQTAEFIGMERSALHRKLKSLDISVHDNQNSQNESKSSKSLDVKTA